MNYAKKLLNKKSFYLFLILSILIVVLVLVLLQIRNNKKVAFLLSQENYSYVKDESTPLILNVGCSRDDTMHFEKKLINKCIFSDYDTNNYFLVELIKIEKLKENQTYENNKYHQYQLSFKLPFSSNEIIKMNNFYLNLEYTNDEKLSLPMGTIAIASNNYNGNDIIISSMEGVVNENNDHQMLVGITLKPKMIEKDIIINKIKTISAITNLNLGEIKEITSEIENDQPLNDLLGKEYDLYNNKLINKLSLEIQSDKKYLIPLIYSKMDSITTLAFIIEYEKNGEIFEQVIYPFKFYSSSKDTLTKRLVYGRN